MFCFFYACIGSNSEDYLDPCGPSPDLRANRKHLHLDLGPSIVPEGPNPDYQKGAGHVRIHGPNPLNVEGPMCFKTMKEEENRAKKKASNVGGLSGNVGGLNDKELEGILVGDSRLSSSEFCQVEVIDEAVWNERQGGVCNTLMQAFCARQRGRETAM